MAGPDIYPGAFWAPLAGWQNRRFATTGHRLFTGHTMVGTFAGVERMFRANGYNGVHSHFILAGDGRLMQLMGLTRAAASDYEGSSFTISVECEDTGSGFPAWSDSNVPDFSVYQKDALAKLCAWLIQVGHVPARVARSSCERGLGYHRLGCEHSTHDPNAPGGPWWSPGCPRLSKSLGKVCPGDRRVNAFKNEIFPRALGAITGELTMDAEAKAAFSAVNSVLERLIASNTRLEANLREARSDVVAVNMRAEALQYAVDHMQVAVDRKPVPYLAVVDTYRPGVDPVYVVAADRTYKLRLPEADGPLHNQIKAEYEPTGRSTIAVRLSADVLAEIPTRS